MTITADNLKAIAPYVASLTLAALFASDADGQPHICRAMAEAGITEPHDVAQFLTVTMLASNGFVNFTTATSGHVIAQSPVDWFREKAKDWFDLKMSDESRTWNWSCIVNHLGVKWAITGYDWPDTWQALDDVCAALGVENRMEEFALQN